MPDAFGSGPGRGWVGTAHGGAHRRAPEEDVMSDQSQPGHEDELLDLAGAAGLLEQPEEQVQAMVDEGLLVPLHSSEDPRFQRSDALAVRLQGG